MTDEETKQKIIERFPKENEGVVTERDAPLVESYIGMLAALIRSGSPIVATEKQASNPDNFRRKMFEDAFTRLLENFRFFGETGGYIFGSMYVSERAWEVLSMADAKKGEIAKRLSYEHLVPMGRYFVDYFISLARVGKLDFGAIKERMDRLYATAILTKEEKNALDKLCKDDVPRTEGGGEPKDKFARIREYSAEKVLEKRKNLSDEQKDAVSKIGRIELHSETPGWQRELLESQWPDGWFARMCLDRYRKAAGDSRRGASK